MGSSNLEILANQSPFSQGKLLSGANFIFSSLIDLIAKAYNILSNPKLWSILFVVSIILSFTLIGIIIYTIVKLRELQYEIKDGVREEIKKSEEKIKEKESKENPKWKYILTVLEGYKDSDWRVAIMEADNLLEDILREKGLTGNSVSELLESAKLNGYKNLNDAWGAHLVRNKIAHEGSEFPLSQTEARRVIKQYQNFFEELGII